MQDRISIIDPHLHLFDLQLGQYQWLRMGNAPHWPDKHIVCKNFSERDLNLPAPYQLEGFVHIEAGFNNQQPWREIDWLEAICKLPFRSIACADLTSANFVNELDALKQRNSVVGIRHILEDDAIAILTHCDTAQNIKTLAAADLIFEAQLYLSDARAVKILCSLLKANPSLKVTLCHAGFPLATQTIKDKESWFEAIRQLSQFKQVAIKLSGWEMQDRSWQIPSILPFIQHAIDSFGEDRVMLASNFPLSLWRKPYKALWQLYTDNLPKSLLNKLCFDNAAQHYHLYRKNYLSFRKNCLSLSG